MFGTGNMTLIVSNEAINDIMKIVESFEDSHLLVVKQLQLKQKKQKKKISQCFIDTLGANLLRNLLTSKCTIRASEGIIRAGQNF